MARPAPTPMPAFAPVESPDNELLGLLLGATVTKIVAAPDAELVVLVRPLPDARELAEGEMVTRPPPIVL